MEMALPIWAILTGGYWLVKSFSYGMWVMNGPGGGLFPLLGGVMSIGFGLTILVRQLRHRENNFNPRAALPVAGVLAIILTTHVVGLIPALGLFVAVWLSAYERYPLGKALAIGVGTGVGLYLLFDYWLAVPVPMGLFEDWLYT
ncbi:MAG: tripartite tricarboxylate transporter TctB family protein [Planctomycetes bacterium]|nr:tripartite tricarboxylate transporter TctB family protein [Planctomycetota bacterium]